MSRFVAIDLAELRERKLSFDNDIDERAIESARMSDFTVRMEQAGLPYNTGNLKSESAFVIQQTSSYFELKTRQYVRDTGRAVLLPYAEGADLDALVSRLGVTRLDGEDDERLRYRYLLALEAFSTAGPEGAYIFHAMTASLDVKDVAVYGPESGLVTPGQVGVYLLSRINSGAASDDLRALVADKLNARDVRPLTDHVLVQSATPLAYDVEVKLLVGRGDPTPLVTAASERLLRYVTRRHRIGAKVTLPGLSGAGHVDGVEDAVVLEPGAPVATTLTQAPWCSSLSVTWERVDV